MSDHRHIPQLGEDIFMWFEQFKKFFPNTLTEEEVWKARQPEIDYWKKQYDGNLDMIEWYQKNREKRP